MRKSALVTVCLSHEQHRKSDKKEPGSSAAQDRRDRWHASLDELTNDERADNDVRQLANCLGEDRASSKSQS